MRKLFIRMAIEKGRCVLVVLLLLLVVNAAFACKQTVSPFAPEIEYVGRVQPTAQGAQFDWSGIQIRINFTGATSLSAQFTDNQNGYDIFLDGTLIGILNTTTAKSTYPVVSGLDRSKYHKVTLLKRTEALFGVATFGGFLLSDDADLQLCPERNLVAETVEPARLIEFIGDSISCGYGIDGNVPCTFSAGTENSYQYFCL